MTMFVFMRVSVKVPHSKRWSAVLKIASEIDDGDTGQCHFGVFFINMIIFLLLFGIGKSIAVKLFYCNGNGSGYVR